MAAACSEMGQIPPQSSQQKRQSLPFSPAALKEWTLNTPSSCPTAAALKELLSKFWPPLDFSISPGGE